MSFTSIIDHNELVSFVKNLNLPFDPYRLSVDQLAMVGNQHLDAIFQLIGHFIPYRPIAQEALDLPISTTTSDKKPIYPAYSNSFKTAEEAKLHRQRGRDDEPGRKPKAANDVARVKRYGRPYWVKRLYDSMIDISEIIDTSNSIHAQRFADPQVAGFDSTDLEAAAHHIFDACLRVHERGWCRPIAYHKNVKRGTLTDIAHDSIERRLAQVCQILRASKAAVDDAVRGGVTLALLVDNPTARGATKLSNNNGNKNRGKRLKAARKALKKGYVKLEDVDQEGFEDSSGDDAEDTTQTAAAGDSATTPSAPAGGGSGVASGRITKARAGRTSKSKKQQKVMDDHFTSCP
jgi:hypothetical protein